MEGNGIGNFRRTLKTKSIRVKNFNKTKVSGSLLNSDMLQDEDIKLFVEVVEDFKTTPELDLKLPDQKLLTKTPEAKNFESKDLLESKHKLSKRTDSDEELKAGKHKKRSRIKSTSSQKKFVPSKSKDRKKVDAKKRDKITTAIEMNRLPSIMNMDE